MILKLEVNFRYFITSLMKMKVKNKIYILYLIIENFTTLFISNRYFIEMNKRIETSNQEEKKQHQSSK